jgi:hypothetical protein
MWTNFFIAACSASAALAGLLFVGLSVNVTRILRAVHLPSRAGATIGALMLIVLCSLAVLIPQRAAALGSEVLLFALFECFLQIRSAQRGFSARVEMGRPLWEPMLNAVLGQILVMPILVAGILLFLADRAGFYWLAAGCMMILIVSALNAWVLLVEILR